jgi:hypothetical protein
MSGGRARTRRSQAKGVAWLRSVSGIVEDQPFSMLVTEKFEPTLTVTWLPSGFVMWA